MAFHWTFLFYMCLNREHRQKSTIKKCHREETCPDKKNNNGKMQLHQVCEYTINSYIAYIYISIYMQIVSQPHFANEFEICNKKSIVEFHCTIIKNCKIDI